MHSLLRKIKTLQSSHVNEIVEKRLEEFSSFKSKPSEEWFYELCFCILAANSKQKTSQLIQEKLNKKLLSMPEKTLSVFIRKSKHRFHNNKAKYIVEARKFANIKFLLQNKSEQEARSFLIKNIKGLGMKEASHFLRNTGFSQNLAILDRHIISVLEKNSIIEKPKTLTPKIYLQIEERISQIAKELNISASKLDLFLWHIKTGEVAK